jgi:hypothetical protein
MTIIAAQAIQDLDDTDIITIIVTIADPDDMPAGPLQDYLAWLDADAAAYPMTFSFWAGDAP